jgi:cold shock CspA family protein
MSILLCSSLQRFASGASSRQAIGSIAARAAACDYHLTSTSTASLTKTWSVLAPFSAALPCQHQQSQSRSFSTDTNDSNNDASNATYLTGNVKFYLRDRLYGFIIPDDPLAAGGHNELWFHRTNIQSPHSFDEFPSRPYLVKHERVKFRVEDKGGDAPNATATDITFENGRQVPLFRKK